MMRRMSGPVTSSDVDGPVAVVTTPTGPVVELLPAHIADVGGAPVHRALPRRGRRTVGAWCFLDHFGPTGPGGPTMGIGPHPHMGLQTVTWLVEGALLHHDSLGNAQPIRPGALNLMTAGHGVVHAEDSESSGAQHGVQLWVAQPERTRNGPADFEHHDELPTLALGSLQATVLVGALGGAQSPARSDTPLVGAELLLAPGDAVVPLDAAFEHALVVLEGSVAVDGGDQPIGGDVLAYLGRGRGELRIAARDRARVMLIGGEPFEEPVLMWWNFVARTREEVDAAYAAWATESPRFGPTPSTLPRVPAPRPFWQRD